MDEVSECASARDGGRFVELTGDLAFDQYKYWHSLLLSKSG